MPIAEFGAATSAGCGGAVEMVTRLLELIEGPEARPWIIGQTPRQAVLDVLQLTFRAALLTACSGCF